MLRIFILGSGFSVKAGAPLSRTVLQAIFHSERMTPALSRLYSYLTDFLFGGRQEWIAISDFEEVLSRLDLIRHYKPYPDVDYSKVSLYEDLLVKEFTQLLLPQNISPRDSAYESFKKLIDVNDTFISFNYDLVLETILMSMGKSYNYNLADTGPDMVLDRPVNLLKLHGSINLFYCPVCGEVLQSGYPESEGRAAAGGFCPLCAQQGQSIKLRHFIIAPTLFKSFTLPALRRLWYKALENLVSAAELYFIGYSLPEADILSYQLLDFGRRMCKKQQDVYVINGPRSVPERFRHIYGHGLKNEGVYFEEWVKKWPKH